MYELIAFVSSTSRCQGSAASNEKVVCYVTYTLSCCAATYKLSALVL